MLKHYLIVAWLNVRNRPFAALINILTLSLGLVCFILAASIAAFWSRADQHFVNAGRTFVMTSEWRLLDGSETSSGVALPLTNDHLARLLRSDFPRIESIARVTRLSKTTPVRAGERVGRLRGFAADPTFLEIFDLPFVDGDPREALRAPGSIILTKEAAQTLFGDAQAIGKSITLFGDFNATVTGIIDRIPDPSHMGRSVGAPLRFDLLASRDAHEHLVRAFTGGRDSIQLPVDWYNGQNATYVMLPADASLNASMLRVQLPAFVERHVPASERRRVQFGLDIVPVGDLLGMGVRDSLFPQQSAMSVPLLLIGLGSIVLAVACINFASLATARAAGRVREVGVRKAIGAGPRQLIVQFLLEAGILTAAALVIALALVLISTPLLQQTIGIDLRSVVSAELIRSGLSLVALGIAVTIAAGFYPAFVLSRVHPAASIRAAPAGSGSNALTAVLVAVQFALATFLLIGVCIVHEQNENLERAGREIAGDTLLVIENTTEITGLRQETLRQELLTLPQVLSDTAMETLPWTNEFRRMLLATSPSASTVQRTALLYVIGHDFFEAFDIPLLAGRRFDSERADDIANKAHNPSRTQNIVISRTLAVELGFSSPAAAVDETVYIPSSVTGETARSFRVIGVVADKTLNIASRYGTRPNAYLFYPSSHFHVVRLASEDIAGTLGAIDALSKRLLPNLAPDRRFVADYFNESYANFARINQAFTVLALIAWTISTVGLYAMAVMVARRRTHEIAIRKTLGARTSQIVMLLLRSFTTPVLIANAIAWPFAYVAIRAYLEVFIDPIALTPWPFVIALVVSLSIAWIAVGGQTWRAAKSAPAQVMRYE